MIRHEYVDHVAALVAASLAPKYAAVSDREGVAQVALAALAVAEALADLRYPEVRPVTNASTVGATVPVHELAAYEADQLCVCPAMAVPHVHVRAS